MSKSKLKEIKGLKRGYKATIKNKKYNFGDGKHIYEVIELAGPKMDKPRIFVDEESVRLFIDKNEGIVTMEKTFTNAIKRVTSKNERKEMQAAKEFTETPITTGKTMLDTAYSTYYKGGSINIETTTSNTEDSDK